MSPVLATAVAGLKRLEDGLIGRGKKLWPDGTVRVTEDGGLSTAKSNPTAAAIIPCPLESSG